MKVDWKALSKTKGYKSLKAAYVQTVRCGNSFSSKEALYLKFQKIISLAKNHSIRSGTPIEEILNQWEEDRTYSWYSYYSSDMLHKLPSGKNRNVQNMRDITYQIVCLRHTLDCIRKFKSMRECRTSSAKRKRLALGKKARWHTFKKKNQARYRAIEKAQAGA